MCSLRGLSVERNPRCIGTRECSVEFDHARVNLESTESRDVYTNG